MHKITLVVLGVLGLMVAIPSTAHAAISQAEVQAVVQVHVYDEHDNPLSSGSGTVIDDKGHVLTNYHVIEGLVQNQSYKALLCITLDAHEPPLCSFYITVVGYDANIDLALLQITSVYEKEGSTLPFADFARLYDLYLPYVNFDRTNYSSEFVDIGDEVQVLGYPGFGGSSITFTKGTVSGFETIPVEGENYPFLVKTDAKLNPGNSGGAAFDEYNWFIGVPTEVAGGYGNIGYIISTPIVNLFLDAKLGVATSTTITCSDTVNGMYDPTQNGCICKDSFSWSDDANSCVAEEVSSEDDVEIPDMSVVTSTEPVQNGPIDQTNDSWIQTQISALKTANQSIVTRLVGRILLQVQGHGEAWYVDPVTKKRFYMKDGNTAYQMLRSFGLGITNDDLEKLKDGDKALVARLKGRIVLQIQSRGEAYYILPTDGSVHYLKDGAEAYRVMRELSLGITDGDLSFIPIEIFKSK